VQCTRRIPQLRPARLPARCLTRPGQGQKPDLSRHGSAIAAGVRLTRREMSRRVVATIPAGRRRAAAACGHAPHVALGWAKWPRAARPAGSGTVPGRRPAINCQKFTALCLFKPPSGSEPYPPRQKTRHSSRRKQQGILRRLSAAVADRPDSWRGPRGRPRRPEPGPSLLHRRAGGHRRPARRWNQPAAGINGGPGRRIAWW
jgi:hypothetical protein